MRIVRKAIHEMLHGETQVVKCQLHHSISESVTLAALWRQVFFLARAKKNTYTSVGVMQDKELKLMDPHASYTGLRGGRTPKGREEVNRREV